VLLLLLFRLLLLLRPGIVLLFLGVVGTALVLSRVVLLVAEVRLGIDRGLHVSVLLDATLAVFLDGVVGLASWHVQVRRLHFIFVLVPLELGGEPSLVMEVLLRYLGHRPVVAAVLLLLPEFIVSLW